MDNVALEPASSVGRANALLPLRPQLESSVLPPSNGDINPNLPMNEKNLCPPENSAPESEHAKIGGPDDGLCDYERVFSKVFCKDELWDGIELGSALSHQTSFYVTLVKFGPDVDEFMYTEIDADTAPLNGAGRMKSRLRRSVGILTKRPLPAHAIPSFAVFLNGFKPCRVDVYEWCLNPNEKKVTFTKEEMHKILLFHQRFWSFHHMPPISCHELSADPRHFLVIPFLGELVGEALQARSSSKALGGKWPDPQSLASSPPCDWSIDWQLVNNVAADKHVSAWEWIASLGKLFSDDQVAVSLSRYREVMFDSLFSHVYESRKNIITATDPTSTFDTTLLAKINKMLSQTVIVTPHNGQAYAPVAVITSTQPSSPFVHTRAHSASSSDAPSTYQTYVKNLGYELSHPESAMIAVKPIPALRDMTHPSGKYKKQAGHGNKELGSALLVPDVGIVKAIPMALVRLGMILPSVLYRLDLYCLIYEFKERINVPDVRISTLHTAFSAPVAHEATNYDQLELLGDAFLKFATTVDLYIADSKAAEGVMSEKRVALISNGRLYQRALEHGLPGLLIVNRFDPHNWSAAGFQARTMAVTAKDDADRSSVKNWKYRSISRKMLADFAEAIVGAYASDGGFDAGVRLLNRLGIVSQHTLDVLEALGTAPELPSLDSYSSRHGWHKDVEKEIGYRFRNRNLLTTAFTHPSYPQGQCNARLEFLGDALMDWLITSYFFKSHTHLDAGRISDLRSACVNNDSFSLLSVSLNFHRYILHNSVSLQRDIDAYVEYLNGIGDKGKSVGSGVSIAVASMSNGCGTAHAAPKVLGDVFEAVAGAVLVDSNWDLDIVWKVVRPWIAQFMNEHANPNMAHKAPVRQMHEYFQFPGVGVNVISYKYTCDDETGNHTCHVFLWGEEAVSGRGNSKVAAKKAAATNCLSYIELNRQELDKRLSSGIKGNSKSLSTVEIKTANSVLIQGTTSPLQTGKTVPSTSVATTTLASSTLPLCTKRGTATSSTDSMRSQPPLPPPLASRVHVYRGLPEEPQIQPPLRPPRPAQPSSPNSDISMQLDPNQLQELGRVFAQLVQANAITISPNALHNMGSSLNVLLGGVTTYSSVEQAARTQPSLLAPPTADRSDSYNIRPHPTMPAISPSSIPHITSFSSRTTNELPPGVMSPSSWHPPPSLSPSLLPPPLPAGPPPLSFNNNHIYQMNQPLFSSTNLPLNYQPSMHRPSLKRRLNLDGDVWAPHSYDYNASEPRRKRIAFGNNQVPRK
ncbi:hypothetical protein SeLEV6574_g07534 [Synchytrium endobioticum]|uniref:Uncharacterized protein n=1 Tax=Synchytrium endobioticum TaxID=286115 RepID=A0A507CHI1_9FUNG|nr:hypothetical protein SeLEV6574_g07534 [Synchytrium endobioticum]